MKTGDQWTNSRLPHLSLSADDAGTPAQSYVGETSDQSRALLWGALISDHPELRDQSPEHVQAILTDWWGHSVEGLSNHLASFPEPFRTTRFRREIRFIESPLAALKPAFDSLRAGESSFWETMDHLGRTFGWNRDKLLRWKQGLKSLAALIEWQHAFMQARDYLTMAFPLGRKEIDSVRESLLQSLEESHHFLDEQARIDFDEKFLKFKKNYMEVYFFLHEDALHIGSGANKDELKIDPVSLRNLDLLSSLQYMDKRYLNRVKLLAKWVQRNQCHLPLRQILDTYPRCYCNYNPCSHQQPADAAALVNGTILEGLKSFRAHLRRCGHLIMIEVQAQQIDDSTLQPINALLGDGPMIPLKPQSMKFLSRVIGKYPNEFLAELRKK
ncbi:MAG TPA: hypothetical protein VMG30_09315 [Acidobacteriota bacterium]|nr:hypothetical protein [Acidobacteriota bacterium]